MISADKIDIKNKKAGFEFEILERFDAGIMLTGSEVKSIRNGGAVLLRLFCLCAMERFMCVT